MVQYLNLHFGALVHVNATGSCAAAAAATTMILMSFSKKISTAKEIDIFCRLQRERRRKPSLTFALSLIPKK